MKKVLEVNVDDLGFGGVFSLIKNILEEKPEGTKIDIACIEKFEKQSNIDYLKKFGCSVKFVGYAGNKIIKQFKITRNLKELISNENYSCVHIHSDVAYKLLVYGKAAKKAGAKKIILHSHAAGVDGNNRKLKELFHNLCKRNLKRIGTDFVTCSDVAAKWMFPNIDIEKIVMLKNGVDLNKFQYDTDVRYKVRNELKIKDEYLIGHVGRFAYQKNHEYLIDVFNKYHQRNSNSKLLLIGEGKLKNNIVEKVKNLHLENHVIFYGLSDRVNELFQAMDIFVLPSNFEGLPIVGVEAQAAGLPVIFSDKITREAKLISSTEYVSIKENDIEKWVALLEKYQKFIRIDTRAELYKEGFDIHTTISNLLLMY